jgi:chemotaxis signal transduction protein
VPATAARLALSLFTVAGGSAMAADWVVGANVGNVPWEFQDASGKIVGFEIDLVNEVAKRAGKTVQIDNIPFNGLFPAVQSGRIHIAVSSITITAKRLESLAFAQPYYDSDQSLSVMIFRLATELFALPVGVFLEVSAPFVVHSVPRRSNALFLGMVNVRGEIMLAASLTHLLGLQLNPSPTGGPQTVGRMAVAGAPEGKWVFPIDEIYGIYLFNRDDVKDAPVVISNAASSYACGVFQWQNRLVALLDPDRIFGALNKEISPP